MPPDIDFFHAPPITSPSVFERTHNFRPCLRKQKECHLRITRFPCKTFGNYWKNCIFANVKRHLLEMELILPCDRH